MTDRPISISASEIAEFDLAISIACRFQSSERFEGLYDGPPPGMRAKQYKEPSYFYRDDGCLVISFDHGWYPFLDNTKGYNRKPLKWYVPKNPLLARAGVAIQQLAQKGQRPGGRVFMHSTGVIRLGTDLLKWELVKPSAFLKERIANIVLTKRERS